MRTSWFLLPVLLAACTGGSTPSTPDTAPVKKASLPHIGEHDVEFRTGSSGERIPDTVYYTIPKFAFLNQDSVVVSHQDYAGKIFVAEFFFTTCTSICPVMTAQMSRLQEMLKKEGLSQDVWLLSHTVDPLHDRPDTLKAYAERIGADLSTWNFVTGSPEDIYYQAEQGYMLDAFPSDTADGGFFHTDKLTLIDRDRHIRGYYDGLSTKSVDQLLEDIKTLLHERPAGE